MAGASFLSQADFARRRKVSRKAVTGWKQKGLLVISDAGLIDVEQSECNLDQRPATYRGGVTHRPVRGPDGNNADAAPGGAAKSRSEPKISPRPAEPGEDGGAVEYDLDATDLTLAEAARRKENMLGLLRKQELAQKGRGLVDRAAAERLFFETARDLRDAWLSWPARVAVVMASELKVDAGTLTTVLTAHVQQHLSELGEPAADFARD